MKTHVFRLHPQEDLKQSIVKYVTDHNIRAGVILSGVGSLSTATIRLAKNLEVKQFTDTYEIVSITGTTSKSRTHIHLAISDLQGKTTGGHLMDGCLIHTTAEIVISEIEEIEFYKEPDKETGFDELGIKTI